MSKNALLAAILIQAVLLLALPPPKARASENENKVVGLTINVRGDDVYVSARLALDAALMKDLRAGIEKKLIFYVDLFRHWSSWPDEFIMGKKIERDVGCDNLKGEYTIVSRERGWTEKTRYASCNELINNALILKNIKLSGLRGLTKGRYYIRVTAESKLMNLPPLLGQMFFFIKDKEFSVHTDSAIVNLGDRP